MAHTIKLLDGNDTEIFSINIGRLSERALLHGYGTMTAFMEEFEGRINQLRKENTKLLLEQAMDFVEDGRIVMEAGDKRRDLLRKLLQHPDYHTRR